MSAQHDPKGLHSGKNPFFREHLLKIILGGVSLGFFWGSVIHYTILKNKLYNTKYFTPQGKIKATETSISISSHTIKEQLFKLVYIH